MLATACGPFRALRSRKFTPRTGFGATVSTPDSGFRFVMPSYSASCVSQDRFRMLPVPIFWPMWPSPVARMAAPPLGRVCEPHPCPANAIFPQLELIQTLSREFERGPVTSAKQHGSRSRRRRGRNGGSRGRKMWRRQ